MSAPGKGGNRRTPHRFSIGIDLGTSNCALAYVDLRGNPRDQGRRPAATEPGTRSRILEIPQWEAPNRSAAFRVLPSFAFYPAADAGGREPVGAAVPVDPAKPVVGM